MFRALAALQKEGFTSADASAHTTYVAAQTRRFTQQYPNFKLHTFNNAISEIEKILKA